METDRISIQALRELGEVGFDHLLALVEVVEAARAVTFVMKPSQRGRFPHADRLRDALARFDFEDAAAVREP